MTTHRTKISGASAASMAAAAASTDNAAHDASAASTSDHRIYTVAKGRSLVTDDGPKGPGDEAAFSAAEARRLIDLGFLLDEDGLQHGQASGPPTEAGTEITEQ